MPNPGPVDGQPYNYREKMAMFGIRDMSAVPGPQEQVSKGAEAKDEKGETADIKGEGEEKVEGEGEKEEDKENGTADIKGKGEEKEDE